MKEIYFSEKDKSLGRGQKKKKKDTFVSVRAFKESNKQIDVIFFCACLF